MLSETDGQAALRLVALKRQAATGAALRRWGLLLALALAGGFWAIIATLLLSGANVS